MPGGEHLLNKLNVIIDGSGSDSLLIQEKPTLT